MALSEKVSSLKSRVLFSRNTSPELFSLIYKELYKELYIQRIEEGFCLTMPTINRHATRASFNILLKNLIAELLIGNLVIVIGG